MKHLVGLVAVGVAFNALAVDVTLDQNGNARIGKEGACFAMTIHHHEGRNGVIKDSPDHLAINDERMRRLDYLLAKCFEKGIYATTDETTGCRLAKVPSRVVAGKLVFTANIRRPQDVCLFYELAR